MWEWPWESEGRATDLAMVREEADELTKGMGEWQTSQKGSFLLSWTIKAMEEKCTFRFTRGFFNVFCNEDRASILEYVSCLDCCVRLTVVFGIAILLFLLLFLLAK